MKATVITAVGKLTHYIDFIPRWFENIKQQTIFDNLEIIIVYVEWHPIFDQMKQYDNFKFILDDHGQGMYNAWNIGIQNATTKYITNWNIDDLRFPSNIELKVALLDTNADIDLVYNWYVASNAIEETFENFILNKKRTVETYPDSAHEFVYHCCMCGPDPLWRKSLHENLGYFDLQYPAIADWEMWVRMAANGSKFKLIPEILCMFFENQNSVSNRLAESRETIEKQNLYNQYVGFNTPKLAHWDRTEISTNKKLSILIPSLNRRKHYLDRLISILNPQATDDVEILINIDDGEKSIGTKRNELLEQATGDYIAFVDDDDIVEDYYVLEILNAIQSNPDVVGIHLLHIEDNILRGLTYHSLKYTHWYDELNNENPNLRNYYRNPNHLNPVKRKYALAVKFPEINVGEDKDYSYKIKQFLKTESYIEKPLYHYLVRTKKEC